MSTYNDIPQAAAPQVQGIALSNGTPDFLSWALAYAKARYYVFPLEHDQEHVCPSKYENGALVPRDDDGPCQVGKVPVGLLAPHGYKDATRDEATIKSWWANGAQWNIGIACRQSGIVAIDPDKFHKPGVDGVQNFKDWWHQQGGEWPPKTPIQTTATSGLHLVFRDPGGCKLGVDLAGVDGVDIKWNGYIVACPATRKYCKNVTGPYSFGTYSLLNTPPADMPGFLLTAAKRDESVVNDTEGGTSMEYVETFTAECQTVEPESRYSHAARAVKDYGLPPEIALQIMLDHLNDRCSPPWSDTYLWEIVKHAVKHGKSAVGCKTKEAKSKAATQAFINAGVDTTYIPANEWMPDSWKGLEVPSSFKLRETGLYLNVVENKQPAQKLVSDPIAVIARTRGMTDGLVIEMQTLDGTVKQFTLPRNRLYRDGRELAQDLADLGFRTLPGRELELLKYLTLCKPTGDLIAADSTGWQPVSGDAEPVFVMPNWTTDTRYRYQPERYSTNTKTLVTSGTMEEWNQHVFTPVRARPFCAYEVYKSLTASLQKFAAIGIRGEILHGESSFGKTTLLQIGASPWGNGADPAQDPEHSSIHRWNMTENAMEAIAAQHNDLPLLMDELGTNGAPDFGRLLYNATSGSGKAAMDTSRNLKRQRTWRTSITGSGEISAQDRIEEGSFGKKKTAKAGQKVRFIDREIPSNAFESREQVDRLKQACSLYFGTLGPAFIERLVSDYKTESALKSVVQTKLSEAVKRLEVDRADFGAVQKRALQQYALAEVAGLLLVEFKLIPGLTEDDVRAAVDAVVDAWAPTAKDISDGERAVTAVKRFFLRNQNRFPAYLIVPSFKDGDKTAEGTPYVAQSNVEISGYADDEKKLIYWLPGAMKDATGAEDKIVAKALDKQGLLEREPARPNKLQRRISVDGEQIHVYAVKRALVGGEAPDEIDDAAEAAKDQAEAARVAAEAARAVDWSKFL